MPSMLSTLWMKGIKGCFVCGKYHRSKELHERVEDTEYINMSNLNYLKAILTVTYLSFVTGLFGDEGDTSIKDFLEVGWAEEDR